MNLRKSGILLHPTSLPGTYGIGTIGKVAYDFVDWLKLSGMSLWQVLPLNPTGYGDSPYSSYSAFAGNPYLIDLDLLIKEDYLSNFECLPPEELTTFGYANFELIKRWKMPLLNLAAHEFLKRSLSKDKKAYNSFKRKNTFWLDDYANYMCKRENHPNDANFAEIQKVIQFFFFSQWEELKKYANKNGISIIGDLPIFVAADSCDVLAHPKLFQLKKGKPSSVAGVPPDYFSETGQLWGNPLYNWKEMEKDGYEWWYQRIKNSLNLYDIIRIDHFRGFESYWSVAATESTAINGKWCPGPGKKFFDALEAKLGKLPIIAEDLGVITPKVAALRDNCGFAGMKVLQFAFDTNEYAINKCVNQFLPHNYTTTNTVIYTGTHDNDTTEGWVQSLSQEAKKMVKDYLGECMGIYIPDSHITPALLRMTLASTANIAIIPLQDVWALDSTARMNTPSTCGGKNWAWRMSEEMLDSPLAIQKAAWLKSMNGLFARNLSLDE